MTLSVIYKQPTDSGLLAESYEGDNIQIFHACFIVGGHGWKERILFSDIEDVHSDDPMIRRMIARLHEEGRL